MEIAVIVAGFLVFAWLLIIVHRRGVRKQLPWFVGYIVWEILAAGVQLVLWPVNRRLYVQVYWWMEAVEIALIVAAVRESFLRIFEGFTSKPGFRLLVWSVIGAVVAYSAWKAIYAPPVQSTRLESFVYGAEFLFRWGIFGIAALTTILSMVLKEPMDTREDAVVGGYGLASFAFLAYIINLSLFGTRYLFFFKYAPSVGYFLAAFWWIRSFSRPAKEFGFKELGIGPQEIAGHIRRSGDLVDRIMRKK